jgi:hypothetical protein
VIKKYQRLAISLLLIIATSSVFYSYTNSNNQIYAQIDLQSSTAGVKITSPAPNQNVPVGQLIVLGTSTDNSTTDCRVLLDLNDIKPMQNTTAAGAGGQQDYSNWTFTYTSKYHLITQGVNELTAKLSCIDNPANVTKYYSVNVTGVAAPTNSNNTTTTSIGTTENNNQTELSADTVNQTRKQTLQIQQEPKKELQTEPSTDSGPQPLKEDQQDEDQQDEDQPESIPYDKKSESFTPEIEPLGESSYSSKVLSEGSSEAVDEEESPELIEPVTQLPNYASDQVQINEDELQPMETQSQPQESLEQRPFDGQEVAPEIVEEQPLEDSQPLEAVNQPQGSPEQQPLETLESSQPIEDLPVESFSQETQPSPSEIQPLDQQPASSEQQPPEPTTYTQEQLTKGVNEVEQPSMKDESVPFVLPFDSQDVTPNS